MVFRGELMKKYSVLVSLAAFLVIFFQNCGKPPGIDSNNESVGVGPSNQQFNKYEVGKFSTISLWDFLKSRFLDVNIDSGVITAYEQGGQVQGANFQLPQDKLNDLKAILTGAEICEPLEEEKSSEAMMCTMVYTYPYATLISNQDQVKLGEKTNGCDTPVDLCGKKAEALQAWARAVVESL